MKRFFLGSFLFIKLFSLMGCSSAPPSEQMDQSMLMSELEKNTNAMAKSLRILYELRNAELYSDLSDKERQQIYNSVTNIPSSLSVPVTVSHHGDAEMLVRQIGRMVRYKVEAPTGKIPQDKPIVKIEAVARPAYDILRDIGAQVANQISLKVLPAENPTDAHRGVILVEYLL